MNLNLLTVLLLLFSAAGLASCGLYEQDSLRYQPKIKVQTGFDHPPVPGTISRPGVSISRPSQNRLYDIFCLPCHGSRGRGDGPVSPFFLSKKPTDLDSPRVRALSDSQLNQIIRNGYRTMYGLGDRMSDEDARAATTQLRQLLGGNR